MPHVTEEIWSNLPGREARLIVTPWPEAGDDSDAGALTRVQEAAEMFRRSGVRVPLEGEELRIFEAVVRPAASGDGNAAARSSGCRRRSPRGGHARQRAERAGRGRRGRASKLARYQRELDASRLTAAGHASRPLARENAAPCGVLSGPMPTGIGPHCVLAGLGSRDPGTHERDRPDAYVESLSPWPKDGFGLDRIKALLSRARRPTASVPVDSRRRHERQVHGHAHDRGTARRRRARCRRVSLTARARAGASGSAYAARRRTSKPRSIACAPQPSGSGRRSSRC